MRRFLIKLGYRLTMERTVDYRLDRAAVDAIGKEAASGGVDLRERWRKQVWYTHGMPRTNAAVAALVALFSRTPRRQDDPIRQVVAWSVEVRPATERGDHGGADREPDP